MGIVACKATIEGCGIIVGLKPDSTFAPPPTLVAGVSSASMRGSNSARMPATRGLTTLFTTDTRPSRIVFNPSPLVSASIPRAKPSKVSRSSPAKLARAKAWSWVGLGLGACSVGAGGVRKAGEERRGRRWADRLVSKTDRGRCRQRRMARCR